MELSVLVQFQYVLFNNTQTYSNAVPSFHVVIFQVVYELLSAWKLTSKQYFFQSKNVKMFDIKKFFLFFQFLKTNSKAPFCLAKNGIISHYSRYSHIWLHGTSLLISDSVFVKLNQNYCKCWDDNTVYTSAHLKIKNNWQRHFLLALI